MAEIKNLFLGAKMNKDLTPRLVSNREYIDARNAAIINSESGESGQLQNVPGNVIETDFGLTDKGLEIIGFYIDTSKDRLFCFITNWNDTSASGLDNFAASTREILGLTFVGSSHYICMYDVNKAQGSVLVSGEFLNFSKTKPILGVNLLENLLFWTDNRNQPRKIDIQKALEIPDYYTNEDNISVAKYYPWQPARLASNKADGSLLDKSPMRIIGRPFEIDEGVYSGTFAESKPGEGQQGQFQIIANANNEVVAATVYATNYPNFTTGTGYAAGQEVIITPEEIDKTFPDPPGTGTANMVGNITLLVRDGNLSKDSTMKDVTSEALPGMQYWEISGVDNPNKTFQITDPSFGPSQFSQLNNWKGAYITGPGVTLESKTKITSVTASNTGGPGIPAQPFTITYSNPATLIDSNKILVGANPDYNANFLGDSNYLSDKFVRFSYRFKYDNGEYSLAAPFTQAAFIPKQDGYFLDKVKANGGGPTDINDDAAQSDEVKAVQSTIVSFMENKVNTVGIVIPMPEDVASVSELSNKLHVEEIDILYKESDQIAIKVVETITSESIAAITDTNKLTYNYTSQSPIKTLPSNETLRASDKVPIRAKAQEVTGNRVMYGNYLVRTARPKTLGYTVAVGEKTKLGELGSYSEVEYPNHVLKQNRSYTLGIVLADRFGRQSDVILSPLATIYNPYNAGNVEFISATGAKPNVYRGNSIKALFRTAIPSEISSPGYAGLYSAENPLGWYSYKIVIQQKEQEYYNVYLPSILNNTPQTGTVGTVEPVVSNSLAFITLFSDNINKVPRDLQEVGPNQVQFSSSENLFGRVTSSIYKSEQSTSFQFIPSTTPDKVVTIGPRNDLGLDKDVLGVAYTESPFYGMPLITGLGSNPLIGRISTQKTIGGIGGFTPDIDNPFPITFKNTTLNVYETAPTRSEIDIFYETSSSGLISELNTDIEFGDAGFVPVEISNWSFKLDEGVVGGQILNVPDTAPFTVKNYQGVDLQGIAGVTVTAKIVSVFSGNNASVDITNRNLFEIVANGATGWFIKASANPDFVYTAQSAAYSKYKFTIEFTVVDAIGALPITTKNNITVNASKSVLKNLPVRSLDGDNSIVNTPGRTVFNTFMNSNINLGSKVLPLTQDTSWGIKTFQLPNASSVDGFIDVMTFNFSNGSTSEGRNKTGLTLRIKEVLVKLPQLSSAYPYFLDTRRSPSDYARLVSPVEGLARFPEKLQINPLYVRVFDPTVTSLENRYEYVTQDGQQVLVEYPGLYTPQTNTQSSGVYTEYLITMEVFDASFQSSASVPPTYIPGVGSTNIANFSVTLRVNNP